MKKIIVIMMVTILALGLIGCSINNVPKNYNLKVTWDQSKVINRSNLLGQSSLSADDLIIDFMSPGNHTKYIWDIKVEIFDDLGNPVTMDYSKIQWTYPDEPRALSGQTDNHIIFWPMQLGEHILTVTYGDESKEITANIYPAIELQAFFRIGFDFASETITDNIADADVYIDNNNTYAFHAPYGMAWVESTNDTCLYDFYKFSEEDALNLAYNTFRLDFTYPPQWLGCQAVCVVKTKEGKLVKFLCGGMGGVVNYQDMNMDVWYQKLN